jgi:hypothetical protein
MTKTRRAHDKKKVPCEHTINGLHEWYVAMFEKLGWMILASKNGWVDKIMTYKNSVDRLEEAIEYKYAHARDHDHKMDLKIMLDNVKCLKEHIAKDFP